MVRCFVLALWAALVAGTGAVVPSGLGGPGQRQPALLEPYRARGLRGHGQRQPALLERAEEDAKRANPLSFEYVFGLAEKLRTKIAGLSSAVHTAQDDLAVLEQTVANVSVNVTQASTNLSLALESTQALSRNVSDLRSSVKRQNHSWTTLRAKLNENEAEFQNASDAFNRSSSIQAKAKEANELTETLHKYLPGGEVRQKIDAAVAAAVVYNLRIRESVDRVLVANNSYALESYVNDTGTALANLTATLASNDKSPLVEMPRVASCCPPYV